MAYQTYTTPAVVCGSWPRNGADKTFLLFTRELGMLYATARSVREERSRQRYALQDCAIVRVSLVRGRSGWRIGSVIDVSHPILASAERSQRIAVVTLIRTVRRFMSGESPTPEVYDMIIRSIELLLHYKSKESEVYVICVQFWVLHALGYVAPTVSEQILLQQVVEGMSVNISSDTLQSIRRSIDNATLVSHL